MDALRDVLSSQKSYDERLRTVGIPVSELSNEHLEEICKGNKKSIASLKAAGGIVVRGTPWIKDSNDTTLRVFYGYEQYEDFENRLISQIAESHSHIAYDAVVALPTGGVNLGIKAARAIGKPLHYAHVTSYDDQGQKGDVHMRDMEAFVASLPPPPARILLIDDLSDSGDSLNFTKKFLTDRGYTVETATIFEKEGTKHKPSFCLFRDFPELWIVQPSEMREGLMAGHNIHGLRDHPISQRIYEVSKEIWGIIDRNHNIKTLHVTVPFIAGSSDARVLMEVIKTQAKYWNLPVTFTSSKEVVVGFDETGIQYSTEENATLNIRFKTQMEQEISRIFKKLSKEFPHLLTDTTGIIVHIEGFSTQNISIAAIDKNIQVQGMPPKNESTRGTEWFMSNRDGLLHIIPFVNSK